MNYDKNKEFKIVACTVAPSNYGDRFECITVIELDSKVWAKIRAKGHLGHLYGVAVSNEVFRLSSQLVPASCPTVSDRDRARNGIKTVTLRYYFNDQNKAERLGIKFRYDKNRRPLFPEWSSSVNLLKPRLVPVTA